MEKSPHLELYFEDRLIKMGLIPRIITRVLINSFATIFIIITAAFLLSPIESFFWAGCLSLLIIIDKIFSARSPGKKLADMPTSGRVNLSPYLAPHARCAIISAHENAKSSGNFTLILASMLFEDDEVSESLLRLDVRPEEFAYKLNDYIKKSSVKSSEKDIASIIEETVLLSLEAAAYLRADFIGCGDLFVALSASKDAEFKKLLQIFDLTAEDLEKALIFGIAKRRSFLGSLPKTIGSFAAKRLRKRVVNRAWTSRPTPVLDKFSSDFTSRASGSEAALMVGHVSEYERMLNVLGSKARPNILLVGEPGVGKNVLVLHLAYMISRDFVPPALFDKRLVSLDIGKLLSGATGAEIQSRVQAIFREIEAAGNIILHIPDIHNLARSGDSKELNAADSIIPFITSNTFPLIGTTYPREWKALIQPDTAFANAFTVVNVAEVGLDDALTIMIYRAIIFEREYGIKASLTALKTAVQISKKYFGLSPLPGSSIDLLKEALSSASQKGKKRLTSDDVITVAESRAKIPIRGADKAEAEKLLDLENLIHESFVGQDDAVGAVSEALREYRSGLSRAGGPIGSFLFVGPTGVGKTELAKILARLQFGSEDSMVRFDMSEFQDKKSIFRLIGSPDGAISGLLTDRILERPYTLILLDEFEKADPEILNLFLQVFDDGRLTDSAGRLVSFENTIIIATSNAHSDFIKSEIENGHAARDIAQDLKKKLGAYFKPELLNRFSGIVVFRDLERGEIAKIAELNLINLARVLETSKGIGLSWSQSALTKIAEAGYDPVFGARPLRGAISELIKNPLSKMILRGALTRGEKVSVELENESIKLRKND